MRFGPGLRVIMVLSNARPDRPRRAYIFHIVVVDAMRLHHSARSRHSVKGGGLRGLCCRGAVVVVG